MAQKGMKALVFAVPAIALAAAFVPRARAKAASPSKVGFIGCLAKPLDAELGTRISESLEERLSSARLSGFVFLHGVVSRARARLKTGPVNPQRIAEAGRAVGADKIVVCLIAYKREHASTVPGRSKTTTVSRPETDYVEEVYYVDVPNPDYEEPFQAALPVGRVGPVSLSVLVGSKDRLPKTIREKHVRRVPRTRTVTDEVTEQEEAVEKPGTVQLRASYVIMDAASGKMEERDTVSYHKEIEPVFDAMESDDDLRGKAVESTVDGLERGILAKLRSPPGDAAPSP